MNEIDCNRTSLDRGGIKLQNVVTGAAPFVRPCDQASADRIVVHGVESLGKLLRISDTMFVRAFNFFLL